MRVTKDPEARRAELLDVALGPVQQAGSDAMWVDGPPVSLVGAGITDGSSRVADADGGPPTSSPPCGTRARTGFPDGTATITVPPETTAGQQALPTKVKELRR